MVVPPHVKNIYGTKPLFRPTTMSVAQQPKVLLGVTGSVAAVKSPEIAVALYDRGCDVCVLLTAGALNFWGEKSADYNPEAWRRFDHLHKEKRIRIRRTLLVIDRKMLVIAHRLLQTLLSIDPNDEWRDWKVLGDPVEHIDLRNWADVLLIAPLSAHTLAKLANGLCDDTLSCVMRAWRIPTASMLVAPAMNTAMWDHPITAQQLATIKQWGIKVIEPQTKVLACGEEGNGAMAAVETIVGIATATLPS